LVLRTGLTPERELQLGKSLDNGNQSTRQIQLPLFNAAKENSVLTNQNTRVLKLNVGVRDSQLTSQMSVPTKVRNASVMVGSCLVKDMLKDNTVAKKLIQSFQSPPMPGQLIVQIKPGNTHVSQGYLKMLIHFQELKKDASVIKK